VGVTFALIAVMTAIELMGPLLAEKGMGGTPWHAHHIVERNGLLTIIALGESVVGTVASLSAVVAEQDWTTDAVLGGPGGERRWFRGVRPSARAGSDGQKSAATDRTVTGADGRADTRPRKHG
jgi:hypothetical protein